MKPKIVFTVNHKKNPIKIIYFDSELAAQEYMDKFKTDNIVCLSGIINIDLFVHEPVLGYTIIRSKSIKD